MMTPLSLLAILRGETIAKRAENTVRYVRDVLAERSEARDFFAVLPEILRHIFTPAGVDK